MYSRELVIPQEMAVDITGRKIKVSGPKGTIEKQLQLTKDIKIEKAENKIKIFSESERRKNKALIGTITSHIENMINGVTKGFTYRLKVVYTHFPITVKVEGDKVLIQNFMGERTPRMAEIAGQTQVKVEGADITVSGTDIEEVGLTAARIEQATRRTGYDRRIFEDGIYIVSKGEG